MNDTSITSDSCFKRERGEERDVRCHRGSNREGDILGADQNKQASLVQKCFVKEFLDAGKKTKTHRLENSSIKLESVKNETQYLGICNGI